MAPSSSSRRNLRKQEVSAEDQFKQERLEKHQQCEVCARIAYRGTDVIMPMLADQGGDDLDAGIYEYIYRTSAPGRDDSICLDAAAARKTAERCARHIRRLQTELAKTGILQKEDQRYTGKNDWARIIAPFELAEIEVGTLLGAGGFSSVYEVTGFRFDPDLSSRVSPLEQRARVHLKETAQQPVELNDGGQKWQEQAHDPRNQGYTRYAIKHLRKGLVKEPERFERAAIDLVLEAQLLLCMDHPNIISMRAWSHQGVGGYASGEHTSFFFVIDRLPETLEDRIFKWRAAVRKYRGRLKMPFQRQKYCGKLDEVLIDRLKVAHDVAAAVEYMHDRRIINRDLKATNIGFDVRGVLKLFDFGLSRTLPTRKEHMEDSYLMSRVGTKYYMAPEVRKKISYNLSADVYSYGVCLWELLSMGSPREALKKLNEEGGAPVMRCPLPVCRCWPDEISNIMTACLSIGPIYRPTIAEVRYNLERLMERMGYKVRVDRTRRRSSFRLDLRSVDDNGKGGEAREDTAPLKAGVVSHPGLQYYSESTNSYVDNFAFRSPTTFTSSAVGSTTDELAAEDSQSADITMQSDLTEKQLMAMRAKALEKQRSGVVDSTKDLDSEPTKASRRTDIAPKPSQNSAINSAIARKLASSRPETEITAETDGTY